MPSQQQKIAVVKKVTNAIANNNDYGAVVFANATPELKKALTYGTGHGCPPYSIVRGGGSDYDERAFKKPCFNVVGNNVSVFVRPWGRGEERIDYRVKNIKGKYLIDDVNYGESLKQSSLITNEDYYPCL